MALLLLSVGSWVGWAQAPILAVSFDRDEIEVPVGTTRFAGLRVVNTSVYAADDIEIFLLEGEGVEMGEVAKVIELRPFSEIVLQIPLSVPADAAEGVSNVQLELAHTYCVGDLCFLISEEQALRVIRTAAPTSGPDQDHGEEEDAAVLPSPERTLPPWRVALPIGLGVALVAALGAAAWGRFPRIAQIVLLGVAVVSLGAGISLRQAQQAQSIGAVLCTSCVGIEESPKAPPTLSSRARAGLEALDHPVELLFFTAEWCSSCPYAKALVDLAAEASPHVSYRLVDVDEDRDAAARHGIIQSGRLIVPAILRLDTGEVIFGVDRLEARLLALLEGRP